MLVLARLVHNELVKHQEVPLYERSVEPEVAHLVVLGVLVVVEEYDLDVALDLDVHVLAVNVHELLLGVALLNL